MSQERYVTVPQIRTLANGERWSLRNGHWHLIEPYGEHYSPVEDHHFDSYTASIQAGIDRARRMSASERVKEVAH